MNARKLALQRKIALWTERSSWDDQYREIARYLLPRSGRFISTDRNKGAKRFNQIYDNTGIRSLRVLAAGMMAGMTSPARPWFRLSTPDTDLIESGNVKQWLHKASQQMRDIFARSNVYRGLHSMYEELGAFGVAAAIIIEDFESVIHLHTLTIGEYAIATDGRGRVNTLCREFEMTISQLVEEFGIEKCSREVQNLYRSGKNLDAWKKVIHMIEPRRNFDAGKRDALNMPFRSIYFEADGSCEDLLREGGYKRFNVIAPRWVTAGGDIYGIGPGHECIGDVKQLQHEQVRKAESIDLMTKPPLQAPTSMKYSDIDRLPGGVSFIDGSSQTGVRTMFESNMNLQHLREDIMDVRERIKSGFYADLFLMLANDTRSGITATEVAERHEEKLLMLGPVLERLHDEMLSPLIDITFDFMMQGGLLPPPPEELRDTDLKVEFVSTLAQAQRAVGMASVDRLILTTANLAAASQDPGIWDKINKDQIIDNTADMLGVDPTLIVPDAEVLATRQQRAQAQQAQQQAAAVPEMAKTAQSLSNTNMADESALTAILGQFQGYSGANSGL